MTAILLSLPCALFIGFFMIVVTHYEAQEQDANRRSRRESHIDMRNQNPLFNACEKTCQTSAEDVFRTLENANITPNFLGSAE